MKEKKWIKKRLISLLLSLALAVSMLPLNYMTVSAAEELSTGNATVTIPVGGKAPCFTAISDEPDKYTVSVEFWRESDGTSDAYLYADKDLFVAGNTYSVAVVFTAVEPYTLSNSYNSTFTINGMATGFTGSPLRRTCIFTAITAYTLTYDANGGDGTMSDDIITDNSSFTLPACNFTAPAGKEFKCWEIEGTKYNAGASYTATKDVTVKAVWQNLSKGNVNIIAPIAGLSPSFTAVSDEPDKYTATVLQWLDTSDNRILTATDEFEAGKQYTAQVRFNGVEPYALSADNSFTINGNPTEAFDDGLTRTYTFTAANASTHTHDCDTTICLFDDTEHWHPCKTDGCHAKLEKEAHNSNKKSGGITVTLENDGKSDDSYCSVCNKKMADGIVIPAQKYIRTSAASMTPSALTPNLCANDLTFTAADNSKYKVALWRVFDTTDSSLNTDSGCYPAQQKFAEGHAYALEVTFTPIAPYIYEEATQGYTSTFTLNGTGTEPASNSALNGSTDRRITLTVASVPSHTHICDRYNVSPKYLKSKATCTNAAVYYKSCSCGEKSSTETFTYGNPAGHNFVTIIDRAATTTQAGESHEECSICHYKKPNITVIPKLPQESNTPTAPTVPTKPTTPTNPTAPTTSKKPAKTGTKFKDSKGSSYKVTSSKAKNPTVTYAAPKKKAKGTIKIPATVKYKGITYKVTSITANAFKNNKKVTSVEIGKNVSSISSKAFYGCKNLKKITVKTTKLTKKKVGKNSFKGIHKNAVIKVPKKKLNAYKKLFKSKGIGKKVIIKKI